MITPNIPDLEVFKKQHFVENKFCVGNIELYDMKILGRNRHPRETEISFCILTLYDS